MAKADELIIEIKGDVSDVIKKFDQISDSAENTAKKSATSFGNLGGGIANVGKALAPFAAAIAAAQAATALLHGAIENLNNAKGLSLTASRLGIATTSLQEFNFAAKSSGIDSNILADAMKDLTVKIKDASIGAASYEEALNLVGLKSRDLVNMPVDKQFLAFADAISKADNATRRFVLDEINDSMFQLLPLMDKGAEGFKEMAERAHELNAVLSDTELKEMNEATTKINEMNAAWDAMGNKVTAIVSGPLAAFANAATKVLNILTTGSSGGQSGYGATSGVLGGTRGLTGRNGLGDGLFQVSGGTTRADDEAAAAANVAAGAGRGTGFALGGAFATDADQQLASDVFGQSQEGDSMMTGMPFIFTEEGKTMLETMREEELEAQRAFNASLQALEEANQDYNKKLWESGWKGKSEIMSKTLGSMTVLMNSENRKMFEIGKAAAKAQVAIDTPKAAMSAYSAMAGIPYVGPILGVAAAAAAIASGAQQMQSIDKQSFGGASVGGGIGGGGASPDVAQSAAPARNVTEATINVQGDGFVSADQVRGLAASLRQFQADGGELVIK
ncbi:MAG: hypothetical protein CO099_06300 [Bdellovibrio sp. CG_4_9_14_3_um_filter_39_7]|nr:MAG: hypothetical protein CO099_06300 [Bdellovibrio sp. CG_4_9_14_3_um_filter_39_7]